MNVVFYNHELHVTVLSSIKYPHSTQDSSLRFMTSYISQSAYRARVITESSVSVSRGEPIIDRSLSRAAWAAYHPKRIFRPPPFSLFFQRRQGYGNGSPIVISAVNPDSFEMQKERDGEKEETGKGMKASERRKIAMANARLDGWPASNSVFIPRSDAPGPFLINSN